MNIESRIKSVIASQLNIPLEKVRNDALLTYDLGADSLDSVEIIMAIEDEFKLSFSDENIKITTVQQIIDYINPLLKNT
jgi:acyl carrier protein